MWSSLSSAIRLKPPEALQAMLARPAASEPLEPDYSKLKERLLRL